MLASYANYNYALWWAASVSEKGPAKARAQSIDFPSQMSSRYADRESLLSWTMITVTGNYTYPEQTPVRAFLFMSDVLGIAYGVSPDLISHPMSTGVPTVRRRKRPSRTPIKKLRVL